MKTGTFFGKEIKINEKDFKKILRRFDVNNFHLRDNEFININHVDCPLCEKYGRNNCDGCQFKKFESDNIEGCVEFIEKTILKNQKNKYNISISEDYVIYEAKSGKKKIEKIYNFLIENFV